MPSRRAGLAVSAFTLAAAVSCTGAHRPARLSPRDFQVVGLRDGADTTRIRRALGRPDSITLAVNPFGAGGSIAKWHYRGAVVASTDRILGITLQGRDLRTARGLRVGDPARRVLSLYGPPTDADSAELWYRDPRDQRGERVILIALRGGLVEWIFLGLFID